MSTAVIRMGVGSDAWNTEIDSTVGFASHTLLATSRISNAMSAALATRRLARSFAQYDKLLSDLVRKVQKGVEKAERGESVNSGEAPSRDQFLTTIRSLEYLYDASKRMHSQAAAKRFTNDSRMAGSLRSIELRADELLDIADWFHSALAYSKDELEHLFTEARAELANGATVGLAEVR